MLFIFFSVFIHNFQYFFEFFPFVGSPFLGKNQSHIIHVLWHYISYLNGLRLFDNLFQFSYHLFYIFDVAAYLATLDFLAATEADLFVPSHGNPAPSKEFAAVIDANRKKVNEICGVITAFLGARKSEKAGGAEGTNAARTAYTGAGFDDILAHICRHFGVTLDINQYVLVGNALRSYLMYLKEQGRLMYRFHDCRMIWSAPEGE